MRVNLVPVRGNPDASGILYELLIERPESSFVSHEKMPKRDEHEGFVRSHPFRFWYLIEADDAYVGAIEVTDRNEIGVSVLSRYQRMGYATGALTLFLETHKPLKPLPAIRNKHWLANIAPGNEASKAFFAKFRFAPIQETWKR